MTLTKSVRAIVEAIKPFEHIENESKFFKAIRPILKKFGWVYFTSGGFADIYHKRGVKFLIKISGDSPFHPIDDYQDGYLKPVYMTANRRLAIQDKVVTYDDAWNASYRPVNEAQKILDEAKHQLAMAKNKHNAEMKKYRRSNIKRYRKIPDLREDNIGIYNGMPVMIDLNSHVFDLYEGN